MPSKASISGPKTPQLYLTAYLTLAAVMLVELIVTPVAGSQWAVAGLLLLFGGLLAAMQFGQRFRSHSQLYLALQTAVVTSLLLLRPGSLMLPLLFCVLSMMAPMLVIPRSAALWVTIFILVNTFHCTSFRDYEHGWMVSLPFTVGYIFCGTFAMSLVWTSRAQRRSEALLAELQVAHQQLQAYTDRVEELAVSQERNRLAREMHDTMGHRLTVAAVQLEGAERLIPTNPARAATMVNTVRKEVIEALAELRRTVATLRTPLDVDLSLLTALPRLAHGFEAATGIKVHQSLPETLPPLAEAQRLALYRVVQEALTNVQRHAQARQVWLELVLDDQAISLLVKDDGCGFDPQAVPAGFGMRGLRERAAHLKGEFHLETSPGAGTQICFHLPLPENDQAQLDPAQGQPSGRKLHCPIKRRLAVIDY